MYFLRSRPRFLSIGHLWLDGMFFIGVMTGILQSITYYKPPSDQRDWWLYYALALWPIFFCGCIAFTRWWHPWVGKRWWQLVWSGIKTFGMLYAIASLSIIFLPELVHWFYVPSFAIIIFIAYRWALDRRIQATTLKRGIYGVCLIWSLLILLAAAMKISGDPNWFNGIDPTTFCYRLFVCLGLAYLFFWTKLGKTGKWFAHGPLVWCAHALALYFIVHFAFLTKNVDDGVLLQYPYAMHHWKAMLEPAISVRAGGWLLWDTPSQYGFIQTLILAVFPVATVWESLYLLNSTFIAITYYLIFYTLFLRHRSFYGFIFSLVLLLYVVSPWQYNGSDPRICPSVGPMRFFWVHIIAWYIFEISRRVKKNAPYPNYLFGHVFWIIGSLWSFESLVFTNVMWLPAIALLGCAQCLHANPHASFGRVVLSGARRLLETLMVGLAVVSAITLFYYCVLGVLPEPELFWIYPKMYKEQFYVRADIHSLANVTYFIVAFLLMAFLLAALIARNCISSRLFTHMALLYVCAAGLWVATSYYVSHSQNTIIYSLMPIAFYMMVLIWASLPRMRLPWMTKQIYKAWLTLLFGAVIFVGSLLFTPTNVIRSFSIPLRINMDITSNFKSTPPNIAQLLAHVPPGGPLITLIEADDYYAPGITPWFLPNTIVGWQLPLPSEFYQKLAERRLSRGCDYGWVIIPNLNPLDNYPWVREPLNASYTQIAIEKNEEFSLMYYERNTKSDCKNSGRFF